MINPKELRIGNNIFLLGCDYNEGGRFLDGTKEMEIVTPEGINVISKYPEDYNPIPLTPEILLDICGFKYDEGIFNTDPNFRKIYWKGYDKHRVFYLDIWQNDRLMFLCQSKAVHVKYLHQLQNLFFPITEEELEIKISPESKPFPNILLMTSEDLKTDYKKDIEDEFKYEMTLKGSFRKENYDSELDCLK